MSLAPGKRLGPYEIVAPIGAGGMGEVFRARDTRLGRDVAIKILKFDRGDQRKLRQRFELEGRVISRLNHPHICSLFDVGEHDGVLYLVMEYLEGETLAKRLKRGPLPLAEALAMAIQVGSALDQAHRRGLLHRDLTPGNIMLTDAKGGHAKLLDFGLAKMTESSTEGVEPADSAAITKTSALTDEGSLAGTLHYMAPEQLEGKQAGPGTDIFAFGAVLYEAITGRKAFAGSSRASIISEILKVQPPPILTLQPMSPPALDRVIRPPCRGLRESSCLLWP
jgi:serine/threonine protein kinase